jgi:hypothetical protein
MSKDNPPGGETIEETVERMLHIDAKRRRLSTNEGGIIVCNKDRNWNRRGVASRWRDFRQLQSWGTPRLSVVKGR